MQQLSPIVHLSLELMVVCLASDFIFSPRLLFLANLLSLINAPRKQMSRLSCKTNNIPPPFNANPDTRSLVAPELITSLKC
ncbi:hypothetical protein Bpfe_000119 [Biomphalaria pfeifferi]|uniref:Uncharacterized protein n=1 Tax=Biomphalaria pfeifferi TaxID=112525 RepID=A0AAD8CBY0_BIOPF|nr:hypothetical protein Bpfe_000119 [Biomphalaria pfeifferi]